VAGGASVERDDVEVQGRPGAATQFVKQNAEACFALASELANAKNIQGVLAIQSRYAQT